MAKITYNTHDNKTHTIDVQNGLTVMEGAFKTIFQELMLIVEVEWRVLRAMFMFNDEWFDKLPTKEDGEEDMLDMAFEPKQNSRLSCQLTVSDELDGLVG
jgi:2Fe-2S ferredoxin